MRISYTVDATVGKENMCEIVLDVDDFPDDSMNISIPAWVPGSYTIRDYASSIRDFTASSATGEQFPVRKKDKSTWTISGTGNQFVRIRYRICTGELIPQRSHIDDVHVYLLGASTFVYIDGYREQSCEVGFRIPVGTTLVTSLEEAGKDRFRATQYDVLADSLTEIGNPRISRFSVEGKEHRIVVCGYDGIDLDRLTSDTKKIVEATRNIFEYLPYKNYTFFFHVAEGTRGGHEHSSSCSIMVEQRMLEPEKYTDFLNVIAHEFFHTYNVKRIKPNEFEKFNYSMENYTTLLWFSEGFTSYYSEILLARSGLTDEKTYMKRLAESIRMYELMPGRRVVSASASSFDAWIRLYRSSSDDMNTYISYYTKGALIASLMNIRILQYTGAQKSLDDVMRVLWSRFRKDGKGLTDRDIMAALREISGNDFALFFEKYINGTEDIDFNSELKTLGYTITARRFGEKDGKNEFKSAGIVVRNQNGKFVVATPVFGYPAYGSGIAPGDEIISYNDMPFTSESSAKLVPFWPSSPSMDLMKNVSGTVKYRIIRRGKIRDYDVPVTEPPYEEYSAEDTGDGKTRKFVDKYING